MDSSEQHTRIDGLTLSRRVGLACGHPSRRLASCRCVPLYVTNLSSVTRLTLSSPLVEAMRFKTTVMLLSVHCSIGPLKRVARPIVVLVNSSTSKAAQTMCNCFAAAPSNGIRPIPESSSHSNSNETPLVSKENSLPWISAPLTLSERREWRDKIGGSWKWSEALPGRIPPVNSDIS